MRAVVRAVVAAALVGGASLVGAPEISAAPELKIAILGPISGPTFGSSMRDGALLAIERLNARGGIRGSRVIPVLEDSMCDPAPALDAANKVISVDRVRFIVGEVCSRASIPISEVANAAHVIQISPASTHPSVTLDPSGATKPYVFRACFIDSFQGRVGAAFAYRRLGARKAFIIFDSGDDYTRGLSDSFAASFRALGGTIVGSEAHTFIDNDFSAILEKVRLARPDVVFLPDQYRLVNLAMLQARAKGITLPFLGGDALDSRDLDVKSADGGYYTTPYDPTDARPEVREFLQMYGQRFKDLDGAPSVPDAIAALTYDATSLLLSAIAAAGSDDTDAVRRELESMTFHGVTGTIRFDAHHDPLKGAVVMHVKDGKKFADSFVTP